MGATNVKGKLSFMYVLSWPPVSIDTAHPTTPQLLRMLQPEDAAGAQPEPASRPASMPSMLWAAAVPNWTCC